MANLKESFSIANKRLSDNNERQKKAYDKKCHGVDFKVGDRVWLYVPAVKTGKTKKLSSLWWGPYTVLDRTSPVNYKIQLIGGTACLIVHRNRLKPCYSKPSHIRMTNANLQTQEPTLPNQSHTSNHTVPPLGATGILLWVYPHVQVVSRPLIRKVLISHLPQPLIHHQLISYLILGLFAIVNNQTVMESTLNIKILCGHKSWRGSHVILVYVSVILVYVFM